MKKIAIAILCWIGCWTHLVGQTAIQELGINYQAVARDESGALIANQIIYLEVSLRSESAKGAIAYREVHRTTTNERGLFTLTIGKGTPLDGRFIEIPWSTNNIWLEIGLAEEAGEPFHVVGASKLLAVPYAFHAGSAETIHVHDPEKSSRCPTTGIPFWSKLGNKFVDDCHFLGTVIDQDMVFKTDNVERLRILADGDIRMDSSLFVGGSMEVGGTGVFFDLVAENDLLVQNDAQIGGNTRVGGEMRIDRNALIGGNTRIEGEVQVDSNALITGNTTVEGELKAMGRLVVEGGADGSQQLQDSYPLLIKGSQQGLAIEVNPANQNIQASGRGNNYVSFWKNGEMEGRIEGMNFSDLDPTGLTSIVSTLVMNPPDGFSYDFGNKIIDFLPEIDASVSFGSFGTFPVDVDFSWNALFVGDPFPNAIGQSEEYIRRPNAGPARVIWDELAAPLICNLENGLYPHEEGDPEGLTNLKSQLLSSYTQDVLTSSINVFGSFGELILSVASPFDPEDPINEIIDVVVDVTNLAIVIGYADINRGVAYESGSGDYAEWLLRANPEEELQFGEVVGVIGGQVSKNFTHADRFMVVSAAPIVLGNMPPPDAAVQYEKIAFMGQVPVRVQGAVNVGDYLLPSGNGDGLAIAVAPEAMRPLDYQRIVGVAWEASSGADYFQLIKCAVGLNHNDMGRHIEQLQQVVNRMQLALREVHPDYEPFYFPATRATPMASKVGSDFSVSSAHPSNWQVTLAGKHYTNRAEKLQVVKDILKKEVGIDLEQYPSIAYIIDHPEQAQGLYAYYTGLEKGFTQLMAQLNE